MAERERRDATTLGREDAAAPAIAKPTVAGPVALDPERYAVGEVLGEGGMGEVRRCRDRALLRDVALKAIRDETDLADIEARFVREAQVQARLAHPAVVPVYDLGRDAQGRVWFTMKRVEGVTLDDVVRRLRDGDPEAAGSYGQHRLLRALARVCLAMDYVHSRGVLHRDLKPANVMLGAFGEVYVLDWGLAKISADEAMEPTEPLDAATSAASASGEALVAALPGHTERGIALGTPAYMAPEQACAAFVDARSDVYALGAILFEVLALEQLLREEDILAARRGRVVLVDARPSVRAPSRGIHPDLDAICMRATATDPSERYPSARALYEALDAFLSADEEEQRRVRLAAAHVARARALTAPGAPESERSAALEEIGSALALVPEDVDARRQLVHLLRHPPKETPPEVKERLEDQAIARLRRMLRVGIVTLAGSWLGGYPLLLVLGGVRRLGEALLVPVAWGAAAIVMLLMYRFRLHHLRVAWTAVVATTAIAVTSLLWGPLFIVPGLAVTLVFGHVLVAGKVHRAQMVVLGVLSLVVPTYLAYARIFDVYPSVGTRGFMINGALGGSRDFFYVGITLFHLAQLIFGARFASRYRDVLEARQLEDSLFSWQLSKLVPQAGGPEGRRPSLIESEPNASVDGPAFTPSSRSVVVVSAPEGAPHSTSRYFRRSPIASTPATEIWSCHDRALDREVALHLARRPDDNMTVLARARIWGPLEHPAIAPLCDVGMTSDGRAFFTAKRAVGIPLTRALEDAVAAKGAVRERFARRILEAFAQVCQAVAYAHERRIHHGALTNDAIVLGSFGEVHVEGWDERSGDARADVKQLGLGLRMILDALGASAPELDAICVRAESEEASSPPIGAYVFGQAIEAFLSGDRDAQVRRELARRHLELASAAAARAFGGEARAEAPTESMWGTRASVVTASAQPSSAADTMAAVRPSSPDLRAAARIEALRELGRAVRLQPEEPEALRLLIRLLTAPPAEVPHEVLEEMEALREASARGPAIAALVFGAFLLVLYPIVSILLGVRQLGSVAIVWLAWAIAEAVMIWVVVRPASAKRGAASREANERRRPRASAPELAARHEQTRERPSALTRKPWPMFAIMSAAMATGLISGPFFVMPIFVVATTMGFVLVILSSWRITAIALGGSVLVGAALAAWTRVISTYDIEGGVVVPNDALWLSPPSTSYLLLTTIHIMTLLFCAEFAARFRDRLDVVETASLVRTWQLTKLLPRTNNLSASTRR